ncbi:hypothetical protein [Emticicia sp. BO119]|uniref:hypothetical protein n=1 Tax=Emticicia sp. BO119 TaxID=2757768 RepID=UPI0015F0584F|nr:hypothetical protein [Emticicia sp. BO119]MBA4852059.1 hypothetical protein [Emticicia sp. BO119]
MDKFRTIPATLEAVQFLGIYTYDEMIELWGDSFQENCKFNSRANVIIINDNKFASVGDWVTKHEDGNYGVCNTDYLKKCCELIS